MDLLTIAQTAELETKLGKIKVQVPSLKKKLEIERKRSAYAGGLPILSQKGVELANIFATLDVIMVESPLERDKATNSWNYDSVYDEEALRDAYDKAVQWLDSFRENMAKEQA